MEVKYFAEDGKTLKIETHLSFIIIASAKALYWLVMCQTCIGVKSLRSLECQKSGLELESEI